MSLWIGCMYRLFDSCSTSRSPVSLTLPPEVISLSHSTSRSHFSLSPPPEVISLSHSTFSSHFSLSLYTSRSHFSLSLYLQKSFLSLSTSRSHGCWGGMASSPPTPVLCLLLSTWTSSSLLWQPDWNREMLHELHIWLVSLWVCVVFCQLKFPLVNRWVLLANTNTGMPLSWLFGEIQALCTVLPTRKGWNHQTDTIHHDNSETSHFVPGSPHSLRERAWE